MYKASSSCRKVQQRCCTVETDRQVHHKCCWSEIGRSRAQTDSLKTDRQERADSLKTDRQVRAKQTDR